MGLASLFRTSLLISVTLGLCLPGWESAINEGFVNMSTDGCTETVSFDLNASAERHSSIFVRANVLHLLLSFSSIMYFCGLRIAACFLPQHIVIINSFIILLCWLHVKPYLSFNTLFPINIFQIYDTICRIRMKQSQQLLALSPLGSD